MWRGSFETLFGQGVRRSYELLLKVLNGCCLPCQRYSLPPEGVEVLTRETPTTAWVRGRDVRGGRGGITRGLKHKVLSVGLSLPEPSTLNTFGEECRK